MAKRVALASVLAVGLGAVGACGKSDGDANGEPVNPAPVGSPEQTGAACEVAADCFPDLDAAALHGEVRCLERVRGGYCTHLCETDDDCCAVPGECQTDLKQVCAPFEATGLRMCFLSCEHRDLRAPDGGTDPVDEQEYCQRAASADFICRSTGGGADNRKVCVPGDCGVGAACATDDDCDPDLECLPGFSGGYCGTQGCGANADCPPDSRCVERADGLTYCARTCASAADCSFCRWAGVAASCAADAVFVETGTTASVCVPQG